MHSLLKFKLKFSRGGIPDIYPARNRIARVWHTSASRPGDERLLRIGKVSVTASDVRNIGEKIHNFFEESGETIPKHRNIYRHRRVYKNYQSVKNAEVAIPAKGPSYLRRVSCG